VLRAAVIAAAAALSVAVAFTTTAVSGGTAIAIVVNPSNDVIDLSRDELRAIFRLERQFWPSGRRVTLLLPPSGSVEKEILLEQLYGIDDAELRKFWVAQLFRGAIPAIPSTVRSMDALSAAVRASEGGISAVPVAAIPAGVRVLRVDGKDPRDPDYPLARP
jgi:ABC-type phosphate transport system substrate-binding protein